MAETSSKRSSMAGRAPIPAPRVQQSQNQNQNQNQTVSLAPLDAVLNRVIGAKIRLKLSNIEHDFIGYVVNVSTAQQILSISSTRLGSNVSTANAGANVNGGTGISMINVASIESFQVLEVAATAGTAATAAASSSSPSSPAVRSALLPTLTNAEVERNVRAARDRALEEVANQGKGVTAEAQELYDALRRTLPVRWANRGGAFIVNENTLVEPPYGPDNCKLADGVEPGPKAERAITVVKRYLEAERKKLADKKSTETTSESEKKGG